MAMDWPKDWPKSLSTQWAEFVGLWAGVLAIAISVFVPYPQFFFVVLLCSFAYGRLFYRFTAKKANRVPLVLIGAFVLAGFLISDLFVHFLPIVGIFILGTFLGHIIHQEKYVESVEF